MILIGAFSMVQGDPYRLMYGSDSYGNTCARRNTVYNHSFAGLDLSNKTYLFAMDITQPFDTVWICVSECPKRTLLSRQQLAMYYLENGVSYCNYDVPSKEIVNTTWVHSSTYGPCPLIPIYKSTPILHRCIPTFAKELAVDVVSHIFGFLNSFDEFDQVLRDLMGAYEQMMFLCAIAFCISLVFVLLIRYIASVVIYIIFGLVAVFSIVASGLLWYLYMVEHRELNNQANQTNSSRLLLTDAKNEHTMLILAIAASVFTVVFMLVMCCLWPSVKLVVDLMKEAGRALQAMPCLLLQPFITFTVLFMFFIYWSTVLLMLATSAAPSPTKSVSGSSHGFDFVFVGYNVSAPVKYFWWYHLIGFIWISEFILACQQMVVAASISIWYFSRDKSALGSPVLRSVGQLVQYHLGSVALGSFIITIVKVPRIILMYIHAKLKSSKWPCAQSLLKCCVCCLWCIERCCKYLHHNAYSIIAIEGQSFCPAAKLALNLIANNMARVTAINTVGDLVLFLGKCAVTAITGVIAAVLFKHNDELHFYALPLLLVCIFAFFISHCFFSLYEMAIDTLFLCFAADNDSHDGAGVHLFADQKLQNFMARMEAMNVPYQEETKAWDPETIPMAYIDA